MEGASSVNLSDPAADQPTDHRGLNTPSRFLGRQPIVDARGHLFGYELLFRDGKTNIFSGDAEQATREVVDHWLMLVPERQQALAFVNCTRDALLDRLVTLLPANTTVLEILEDIEPDAELIECCHALRRQGYRFALDDFAPRPSLAPFLELADFIKIDFRASDFLARREIYEMVGRGGARLLAEKVETEEEMKLAISEGCSLLQGYFFSHPVLLASRVVPQNYVVYLRLLAALHHEPADLRQIEKLVLGDPSLCYRVLRLANSALQGHAGTLTSVREALLMIGDNAVRRLVTVAMAGALAGTRSPALVSMAISRARFCELLAPALAENSEQLYLLGMLSLLDVLLEIHISRVLQAIPLNTAMKGALLGDQSVPGRLLELARSLEECDWHRCEDNLLLLGLDEPRVAAAYVESMRWASSMMNP